MSFSGLQKEFWNERYSTEEFAYGEDANVFVKECFQSFVPHGNKLEVVELASGEGRNVVFVAQQGHSVTGVDFSEAGLTKTNKLAAKTGTSDLVKTEQADVLAWFPLSGPESIDVVIGAYCHITADENKQLAFQDKIKAMLKPGGLLVIEAFSPNQITKGYRETSGGPKDIDMTYTLERLRKSFSGSEGVELVGEELEYELAEGPKHAGLGAVVRFAWRKNK